VHEAAHIKVTGVLVKGIFAKTHGAGGGNLLLLKLHYMRKKEKKKEEKVREQGCHNPSLLREKKGQSDNVLFFVKIGMSFICMCEHNQR
jgi:hypothetical protein